MDVHVGLRMSPLRKLLLFLGLALLPPGAAAADARYAAVVVDDESGAVLQAIEATARWYPASLTKMMTVYLTFEAIEAGTLDLAEELTASASAAAQPSSELGLAAGDRITVEQAILAVILQSANDAAVVLAERIAGTEAAFASTMTNKAKSLGMTRTVFRNATGLPDPEQVTTARDMAVLGRALVHDFPQHYHFFSQRSFSWGGHTFGTVNGILSRYAGADGIKTGFTCGSGFNLVASATRDGRRLIGVLLGGLSNEDRHSQMGRLLDAAFAAAGRTAPGAAPGAEPPLPQLAELIPPAAGDDPPPFQLSASECTLGASNNGPNLGTGRLPGWGVILGAYGQKAEAQKSIAQARANLKGVVGGGRPAIVPRKWEGVSRYSALLVGLDQQQASKACKHIWSVGAYCLALSPEVLNNPQAVWR
jgi:D-alanyl-D-alanine carboxypeptidase